MSEALGIGGGGGGGCSCDLRNGRDMIYWQRGYT